MSQPFDSKRELIVISAEVFGPKGSVVAELALDTAATESLLHWDLLLAIGYDPGKEKDRVQITTGSSVEYAPRVFVKRLRALDVEKRNFGILCHNLPPGATVDGLLGLDFLRKRRLVVDFRKGRMSLT